MGEAKAKLTLPPELHSPAAERGWEIWGSCVLPITVSSTGLASDLERALRQFVSLKDKVFICNIKASKQ